MSNGENVQHNTSDTVEKGDGKAEEIAAYFRNEDNERLQMTVKLKEVCVSKEWENLKGCDSTQEEKPLSLEKGERKEHSKYLTPQIASLNPLDKDGRSVRSSTSRLSERVGRVTQGHVTATNKEIITPITNGVGRKSASVKSYDSKLSKSTNSVAEVKKPASLKSAGSKKSVLSNKSRALKEVVSEYGRLQESDMFDGTLGKAHSKLLSRRGVKLTEEMESDEMNRAAECFASLFYQLKYELSRVAFHSYLRFIKMNNIHLFS